MFEMHRSYDLETLATTFVLFSDNDQIGFSVVVIRGGGERGVNLGGWGSGRVCRTPIKKETSNNGAENGVILDLKLPHKAEACFCSVFLFSMEDGLKFLWNDVQSYFAFFLGYFFLSH